MAELHQSLKSSERDAPERQDTSGGASKNSSAKICFGHLNMAAPELADLHEHLSTSYVTILDASKKTLMQDRNSFFFVVILLTLFLFGQSKL